jgi:hypothetical protein
LLLFLTGGRGDAAPVAGTKITNQATATYQNVSGKAYAATSNVVNVLVAAVASLTLGPEDAACTQPSDGISSGSSFSDLRDRVRGVERRSESDDGRRNAIGRCFARRDRLGLRNGGRSRRESGNEDGDFALRALDRVRE